GTGGGRRGGRMVLGFDRGGGGARGRQDHGCRCGRRRGGSPTRGGRHRAEREGDRERCGPDRRARGGRLVGLLGGLRGGRPRSRFHGGRGRRRQYRVLRRRRRGD